MEKEKGISTPIIISVCNHKGGVGKTAITANLATYLLKYYNKVFVVDMDPQGNISDIMASNYSDLLKTRISDLLRYAVSEDVDFRYKNDKRDKIESMASEAIVDIAYGDKLIAVITATLSLTKTKIELAAQENIANFKIRELIRFISSRYDLVLIDTPPSIELLTFSSLASSNYIIIPIQLDAHAVNGALDIIKDIMPKVKQYYNPTLELLGVVVNTHESNTRVGRLALARINEIFGDLLFNTKISRSIRIGELSIMKEPLAKVSSGTKSDKEFQLFAEEVYRRIQKHIKEKRGTKDER